MPSIETPIAGPDLRTAEEWRALLVDAIESVSEAFGLFDADDRLILCNRRYAQTFTVHDNFAAIAGWHFTDLVRASIAKGEVIEPAYQGDVEAWVAERARRHRSPSGLRQIQLSDGTWLQVSERPTRSGGIVGVRTDITALKQAQHAAEAANESKTRFLRTMSHEIRTPMNGVLGMAQLLADSRLDATQRRYVEAIEQSGRHLLAIINDILDFSKVESGLVELEETSLDLAALVEDSAVMLAPAAQAKGLELVVDIDPSVPFMLQTDPLRLQQIIINLVNNAVKFTETGEITLTLRAASEAAEWMLVDLSVSDSGPGVEPHLHEKIFEYFAQADSSTARKYGGTGLGLAICRQLAHLMGGDIVLESAPGQGSTFRLTLALRVAESAAPVDMADLAGVSVLLVEDHAAARMALARRLAAWGLDVTAVASGTEALVAMKDGKFQVALIDMTLPEGGLALASSLRTVGGEVSPRIVMLTAGDTPPAQDQATLAKPVRSPDLLAALRSGSSASDKAATSRNAPLPRLQGRVLLAEDNEVNRTIVIAWLSRLGLTTVSALNGVEAVAKIREGGFDLVLMDCQMPEMDGFAATEEIRALEAREGRRPVPIVALTANAMEGDRDSCLKAGMNDYLTKPFRGSQLTEMLLHWLQTKPDEAAAHERAAFAELATLCRDYADHGRPETLTAIEAAWTNLRR